MTTTAHPRPHRSVYEWWPRKVLNLAEMVDFGGRRALRQTLRYETAREALFSSAGATETQNCAIFALSAARRGQCGPCGPPSQAPAMACDLELSRHRPLPASPRARVKNRSLCTFVFVCTRPKSNQTDATSGSSMVELTKPVPSPGGLGRSGTALRFGSQGVSTLEFRVRLP